MESIIIIVHVIAAIAVITLVLLQQGKGAEMGASFGSGASQTLFGSSGSGNVLTKATTIFATVFFVTSLSLAVIARQAADLSVLGGGLIDDLDQVNAALNTIQPELEDIPVIETGSDIPIAPE
ncbi:MAG: preprotein translocase subunit SecG [SAR86 cluster bacterium]|uniref:Protein-export membrane protein SecG n=1 Tax=SAR86 cluster bacterium TaxID=2030880 RepID=A0A2A5CH15_9GAMM|nr:MAG: preprotein translocase subunit SecG [SAR86 cluster bacterium]